MTTTPTPQPPKRGYLRWVAVYVIVLGLIVVFAPDRSSPATPDAAETTLPEVVVPSYMPTDEPVADAAAVILPSVVHIQTATGVGSGVVYGSEGLIVTAAHVVGEDETVMVRFSDGSQAVGTVKGTAPQVDVAVIEVDRGGLHEATFSLVKPRVGQMAVAVGSPWGLASTVTAGIISAVDQTNCPEQNVCAAMVQTDAAINPGNSGGALINRVGEVVGINVSIFTLSGASDGVGFAIPSNTVVAYADAIITGEPLQTAFLGVGVADATGVRAGALITQVFPDTGADNSDLKMDDIVVSVAGVPVVAGRDLAAQIRSHRPGDTIVLGIVRDGIDMQVTVTLGVRAEDL